MEESRYHNIEFYEKYVLDQLSESEETDFEEHMLLCEYCREQISLTENIVQGIANQEQEHSFVKKKAPRKLVLISGAAASILVLIGIGINWWLNNPEDEIITKTETQYIKDTNTIVEPKIEADIVAENTELTSPDNELSTKYAELAVYENAIENSYRSSELIVIKPLISQEFKQGSGLVFEWTTSEDKLLIVIFDNKGNILLESHAGSPFLYPDNLDKGLYYWQLENDEESVFTGKFLIM